MRDVRRDGLIEAFLIAFTPLHGLLYPRYIQYQSDVADPHHIRPWLLLLPPPFLSLSLSLSFLLFLPPLLFAPFSPFAFLFCIPCFIHLDLPPPPSIFIGDRVSPVRDTSIITSVYTLYTHCVKFLVNIETRSVEKRRKKGKIRGRVDTIYLYRRASSYLHEICSRSSSSIYSLLSSITDERILAKKIASIIESMFEFDDILTDYNRFVIRFARILFDYHGIAMIIVHDNGPIKIKGHGKGTRSKIERRRRGEKKKRGGGEKKGAEFWKFTRERPVERSFPRTRYKTRKCRH